MTQKQLTTNERDILSAHLEGIQVEYDQTYRELIETQRQALSYAEEATKKQQRLNELLEEKSIYFERYKTLTTMTVKE